MRIEPTTEHGNYPSPIDLNEFRKGIYNKAGSNSYVIQHHDKYFTMNGSSFNTFSTEPYDKIEFFSNSKFVKNSAFNSEKCFYKNSYQNKIASSIYSIAPYQPKTQEELSKVKKQRLILFLKRQRSRSMALTLQNKKSEKLFLGLHFNKEHANAKKH